MKHFSNKYIILYTTVLVTVVALVLAVISIGLQPRQEKNREMEKMYQILTATGYQNIDKEKVIDLFNQVAKKESIDNTTNQESKNTKELYIVTTPSQSLSYVISLNGKGLWGPVWGYLAIDEDMNTIIGAVFSHKSETPGLGAEITEKSFTSQFIGKTLFDENGNFVSVKIVKGGVENSNINPDHAVDAISGGTITSQSVEKMIADCLTEYIPFLEQNRKAAIHTDNINPKTSNL